VIPLKKIFLIVTASLILIFSLPKALLAQGMMGDLDQNQGETYSDADYEKLGEEQMQRMMGSQDEAMDKYMEERYGKDFVDQMHIVMGKMSQDPSYLNSMDYMMGGSRIPFGLSGNEFYLIYFVTAVSATVFFTTGSIYFLKKIRKR